MARPARLLPFLLACAAAWPAEFAAVRHTIRNAISQGKAASVALSVSRRGEILLQEAHGWADRKRRIPATAETPYSLASVTKPITATALMLLVQRGLVDLDRPINDYLGEAKLVARVGDAAQATVRRVAAHTAGLALHYHFFPLDENFPRPPMIDTIRRYGVIMSPPGRRPEYSNLGYGILEYVIEQVSGTSYGRFLQQELFAPLGMRNSSVPTDAPPPLAAVRYRDPDTPLPFYDFDHRGASAVYAGVRDLTRFAMMHLGQLDGPLDAKFIRAMRQPSDSGARRTYGIGWRLGRRLVSHSGAMAGVRTVLILVPDEAISVAVLANGQGDIALRVANELLQAVRPGLSLASATPRPARRPPRRLRGHWTGEVQTWAGSRPIELRFQRGRAQARLADQPFAPVSALRYRDGIISGVFPGDVRTPDASRKPHRLRFKLAWEGGRLQGAITAVTIPSSSLPNALSYWTQLSPQGAPRRP